MLQTLKRIFFPTKPSRPVSRRALLRLEELEPRIVPSTTDLVAPPDPMLPGPTAPTLPATTVITPNPTVAATTTTLADRALADIKADLKKAVAEYDSLKDQLRTEAATLKEQVKQAQTLKDRIDELKKELKAETDDNKKLILAGQIKEAAIQYRRIDDEVGAQTKVVKDLIDKVGAAKKKVTDLLDELDKAKKDEEAAASPDTASVVAPAPGDWSDIADDPDALAAEQDLADGDAAAADAQAACADADTVDLLVLADLSAYGITLDDTTNTST